MLLFTSQDHVVYYRALLLVPSSGPELTKFVANKEWHYVGAVIIDSESILKPLFRGAEIENNAIE